LRGHAQEVAQMKRLVGLVVLSVLVSLTATVLAFWAATRRQPEGGRG
jgi:hypothetical protein